MKRTSILLFFAILGLSVMAQSGRALDLKDITSGTFRPEAITGVTPMPDGEHYTQMNSDGTQILKYSFKTGEQVEVVFDVAKARECTFKNFDGYSFSPDGTKILIRTETQKIYRRSYSAVHYIYTIKRNIVEPLSDGGPQQAPVFSPDGHMVAFVRDNNIFLVKMLYNNSESQITEDGKKDEILNGIPDWVYEEEFGFNSALEFSPDNEMLCYVRFDETAVPSFSFQLFAGEEPHLSVLEKYPGLYSYKYPKAGEENARVSVHSFDIRSKVTRKLNIPIDPDGYIPRIRFTKDPSKLAVMTLNRHQNRFDMYFVDPKSTVGRMVLRDESPYYINENVFDNIRFYDDNFSFLSEKDGFPHLYWYSMGGNLVKQVTSGRFEVKRFIGWDADSGSFYYESNEESPLRRAVYKIDKKGKKSKLSERTGTNTALFSTTLKYYINTYSSTKTPPVITLNNNDGKVLKSLVDNSGLKQKLSTYEIPEKEFFTFNTSEGVELNGWIIKPAGFTETKKYPVVMYQYSGPGSQEVLDRWTLGWDQYLAGNGFIVACVDGRGTGGRGADFAKSTYLNLGVKESKDQVEAAIYLGNLPYVDKTRIGIWGWSFGGYMTIMSMSEGRPVFKAGAAVASVTDWKFYDTIYAERFMRTPKENAEGYRAGSAFSRAGNLNGRLLLVHGMADDNVHFQNVAEYSERLVQIGKQFDMQIYTNRDHGIWGGNTRHHLYTRLTEFFTDHLKK